MKMLASFLCLILLISIASVIHVSADGEELMPEEYSGLKDYIPDDIRELLPDGIFSENRDEVSESVNGLLDFGYVFDLVFKVLNVEIRSSIKLLLLLLGALMLSSLINGMNIGTLSGSGVEIGRFISGLLLISVLLSFGEDMINSAGIFFSRINIFMSGMLPLFCTLCAMGGGIASAVAANYGISAFIAVSEMALAESITPIVGTSIALAAIGGVGEGGAGRSLLRGLKKTYIFLIGMLMTLMLFVFSAKGILAHTKDSLAGRTVKFAAGSFIPIVGANIGEILRGVGSGIAYVKNTVGVISVVIIFLMVLPAVISVVLRRFVLSLAETAAETLGAPDEARLLHEFSSIYGMLLAVISMSAVLFIGAVIICVRIGNTASGQV